MNGAMTLTIAEVAERTGVSAHTLRYYERIGLISAVERTGSGHRRYAAGDLDWVRLLSCLRDTGMGIRDLLRFVTAEGSEAATAEARLAVLEAHQEAIRARQRRMEETLALIGWKIERYRETLRDAAGTEQETA